MKDILPDGRTRVRIGTAAKYLGVSIQTLRNWQKSGEFPPDWVSTGGHRYYYVIRIMDMLHELNDKRRWK